MIRQKQIKNLSFADLTLLSASTLTSPEYAYIESENKHYTRIAGVNTVVNPNTGGGGAGTVTSVSVVPANGLTGTVATSTTTPALTLGTSVTGLIKGNGTGFVPAVAGTDFTLPNTAITAGTGTKITYDLKGFVTSSTNATATDIVNTPSGNTSATTVQAAITELQTDIDILNTSKQTGIQFKDESVNLGATTVDAIDFTGSAVTATRVGNTVTVNVASTSGGSTKYPVTITGGSANLTARVKATAGVTITKTNPSTLTFTIPVGGYIDNYEIYHGIGEFPGSVSTHVFNYLSNTVTNQGLSTSDAPDIKAWYDNLLPVNIFHARNIGSNDDFVTQISAVGSGNITMVMDWNSGSTGLGTSPFIVKGNF